MSGNVKRFRKDKGYESISREMLQDEQNLSLEAMGLLSNLLSYADNWTLYKTELYKRFAKAGRTKVNNAWNELVEEGYIVQFRKRNGRKYDYSYYFQDTRFTNEDIKELKEIENNDVWDGKTSNTKTKKKKVAEKKVKKDGGADKQRQINDSSSVDFEQSNLDSPKRTDKKLITKEVYNQRDEEEENYIYAQDNLKQLVKTLKEKNISNRTIKNIVDEINKRRLLGFSLVDVIQQLNHMASEHKIGVTFGQFHTYFVNGLSDRTEQRLLSIAYEQEQSAEEIQKQQRDNSVYFDWRNV